MLAPSPDDRAGDAEVAALIARAQDLAARSTPPHVWRLAPPLYRRAIGLAPDRLDLRFRLAKMLHRQGDIGGALAVCDDMLARWPDAVEARMMRAIFQIPVIYRTADESPAAFQAYLSEITALADDVGDDPVALRRIAAWADRIYPYFLPYAGLNVVQPQRVFGAMMCRAMAVACPAHAQRPSMPALGGRLRIGFVSRHFYAHSNWRGVLRGWMSGLDPQRFALHSYSLGTRQDACTDEARGLSARFVSGDRSFDDWCDIIAGDRLHMLIYPAVGDFSEVTKLAMLRLAPVQCVAVGHCMTTGLPSVDYMLSGDLTEPADAAGHYTEHLVRLPGLGFRYSRPQVSAPVLARQAFGLRPGATVFLCANAIYKFLPQHDRLYARIARQSGDCQMVFVHHPKLQAQAGVVEDRLRRAFQAEGLDPSRHLVFLPRQSGPDYHDLQCHSDIHLDSIGWTGGTTSSVALGHDLPLVTIEGDLFRNRMGAAMLRLIGVPDTIAATPDDYVAIAVRLAQDRPWRQAVRQRIAAGKHLIYDDEAVTRGLAAFIEDAVRRPPAA